MDPALRTEFRCEGQIVALHKLIEQRRFRAVALVAGRRKVPLVQGLHVGSLGRRHAVRTADNPCPIPVTSRHMLTPAEELGLAGAALDARVRRAVNHIPDSTLAHLERRLAADARVNEVVYERDGVMEPVRIMLRPLLVMPEQITYLHRVCSRIVDALKGVPQFWLEDPRLRRLFPFAPAEEAWIREAWSSISRREVNPLYARLDAVCDFTGARWQDSLQFLEPNLSGVGGIQMGPLADSLVMRDVVPTILDYDPELSIEAPRDQRDLFLQVLLDHARIMGRNGTNICLVEPKYIQEGPNEQSALARFLQERHGITVVHADPRELRLEGEEVFFGDTRVDVAYRDYEVRDLLALEREDGRALAAMRALFRQNRMVSSVGGEFDHKACWELLTDDELAATYYSASERRMFHRHVLWTRVLSPRLTSLPDGSKGDLPEFAHRRREELVLKPNRGYGGAGIRIGSLTPAGEWDSLIERALRTHEDPDDSWVVQLVKSLPVYEFPLVDDAGRAHAEPYYGVMGFTPTDNGLAMLCRVSQRQVVNVAQQGGLAPLLIGHRPRDLRAPMRAAVAREQAERQLAERIRRLRDLDAVISLLFWDEETYLPDGGRAGRGTQLGAMESLRHELLVDDGLGDLIEEVAAQGRRKTGGPQRARSAAPRAAHFTRPAPRPGERIRGRPLGGTGQLGAGASDGRLRDVRRTLRAPSRPGARAGPGAPGDEGPVRRPY